MYIRSLAYCALFAGIISQLNCSFSSNPLGRAVLWVDSNKCYQIKLPIYIGYNLFFLFNKLTHNLQIIFPTVQHYTISLLQEGIRSHFSSIYLYIFIMHNKKWAQMSFIMHNAWPKRFIWFSQWNATWRRWPQLERAPQRVSPHHRTEGATAHKPPQISYPHCIVCQFLLFCTIRGAKGWGVRKLSHCTAKAWRQSCN